MFESKCRQISINMWDAFPVTVNWNLAWNYTDVLRTSWQLPWNFRTMEYNYFDSQCQSTIKPSANIFLATVISYLYIQTVYDIINKEVNPESYKYSPAHSHSVRYLILCPHFLDPHLQKNKYAYIFPTVPNHLHLIKLKFVP